jgi:hypothetical protein
MTPVRDRTVQDGFRDIAEPMIMNLQGRYRTECCSRLQLAAVLF